MIVRGLGFESRLSPFFDLGYFHHTFLVMMMVVAILLVMVVVISFGGGYSIWWLFHLVVVVVVVGGGLGWVGLGWVANRSSCGDIYLLLMLYYVLALITIPSPPFALARKEGILHC